MPGHEILSRMILLIDHFTGHGASVDVDIDRRHEDGYLEAVALQVFIFRGLLDHHDFAIGRGQDGVGVECAMRSRRIPEEDQKYDQEKYGHAEQEKRPQGEIEREENSSAQYKQGRNDEI